MKTPDELRVIADKVNSTNQETYFHKIYLRHKAYLEKEMLKTAKHGGYVCWSADLHSSLVNNEDVEDAESLYKYLKTKIETVFGDAYGYKIESRGDYVSISWDK